MLLSFAAVLLTFSSVFGAKLPWTTDHTYKGVSDGFKPPKWYHGNDGPIFGVEESREGDVEKRSYHPSADRTVKQKWTVEYFIPHELHAKPYAPSAEDVNVLKFPQMDVWVKVFGGYAKEEDVINQAFDFFDELDKAGIKVRTDLVGVAFYDKPYHIVGRHNEIWAWPAKQQEMSTENVHEARAKLQQNMEEILRQNIRGA
ncbi:regulatory factor, effector binding domain-containing protein [Dunaliella salina]|uniref:Regulatory factor, effector binding domain-containing protein n=1 Tax=Dunaliella salina TaxID=3046 RepID=A0ABQ7G9K0_DUNSA|nr:regulatory factor, effector binding domain-containing protein [Dunaliella salina]|eukprot:KAF5831290.1 regulatory factor, effector binding domain-containing protein [Dunaliella salina]